MTAAQGLTQGHTKCQEQDHTALQPSSQQFTYKELTFSVEMLLQTQYTGKVLYC